MTHFFCNCFSFLLVRASEKRIFQTIREPQFPIQCTMPDPANKAIRRLGESIDLEIAEKACAHWGDKKDLCVYDVLAMNDLELAEHPGVF